MYNNHKKWVHDRNDAPHVNWPEPNNKHHEVASTVTLASFSSSFFQSILSTSMRFMALCTCLIITGGAVRYAQI